MIHAPLKSTWMASLILWPASGHRPRIIRGFTGGTGISGLPTPKTNPSQCRIDTKSILDIVENTAATVLQNQCRSADIADYI